MFVEKAYILKIDDSISNEYAATAAKSCEDVKLKFEFHDGPKDLSNEQIKKRLNWIPLKNIKSMKKRAACATAGHFEIWKKIRDNKECAIVLEHDAIMLHSLNLAIPDNCIVNLGYKFFKKEKYDFSKAGPPTEIKFVNKHAGAHAYAINYKTAEILINELKENQMWNDIDNAYFMRRTGKFSKVPCAITDPICAIGWLRKSTIWGKAAQHNEKPFLKSFTDNLSGGTFE